MTRLSTKPTSTYQYLQLRQRVLTAVIPVHTHQEYITFKSNINRHDFRKGGKTYPPHERWKNVDFEKFAQWWNSQVNFQSRTITDSNLRLYYKLPQHLEAHHKKTISWSSERSTLAAGANFAARQAFLEILNSEDNLVDVLPAIPFAAIPDGELNVSVLGLSIPMSFDLMAGRPDEGEQLDSHFPEFEPRPVIPVIATAFSSDEIPPPFDPDEEFDVALHVQPTPTLHQIQRQVLLPGASVPEPTASKSAKRCAVCVKAFCLERHKCPGRSKKKLCKHPRMASGDRARISEDVILGYWAQRLPSSGRWSLNLISKVLAEAAVQLTG
ncbi:hypothetical protein C8F04DRAFT_1331856 [Mycena alexandri]|uniref:Uncharacterized protein n=1 Tax=Mycena alexandri TaxID=1745969 RepID=A0AAD6RYM0_9AGAR|nr:hypothetical protein C8F04DRAFT_1331856 [Mycena alexandri]